MKEKLSPELYQKIAAKLRSYGIPPSIGGHEALIYAIAHTIECKELPKMVPMYSEIAKVLGKTTSGVERTIRYAITYAFEQTHTEALEKTFNNLMLLHSGKVTNSVFIATVAHDIRLEMGLM